MIVTFFWNYLNHHQVFIADAIYNQLGDNFRFVATLPRNVKELKGGADYSTRPYCILAGESEEAHRQTVIYAESSDVCVFGACSQEYAVIRAKNNPKGLSFECGERWLKRGLLNVLSPVLRQWWLNYMCYYRKANYYKLCSSAYAAQDDERLGCYKGRHYKWGYFTNVEENFVEASDADFSTKGKVHILWCARFLLWKHPELVIELAARLKKDRYDVAIDMYGDEASVPERNSYSRNKLLALIDKHRVADIVSLKGNRPNSEILKAMQEGDIFLFTSDRLEGWGAVANEALSNGSVLVASDAIGSTPYLVKHKETGMIFRSCDLDSLYEQVKYLLDNPKARRQISKAGRESMVKFWSPQNAAKSLLQLIEDIQAGRETSIVEGPCSKA